MNGNRHQIGPLLLLFLLTLTLQAQSPKTAETGKPGGGDEKARVLLDRAIASQLGGLPRDAVRSFQGEFGFKMYREGDDLVGDYEQAWAFDEKGRFHYRRRLASDLSKKERIVVCNGRDEVFGLDRRGGVVPMNRAKDEKDRENVRTEKQAALRLYQLFFLNQLEIVEDSLKLAPKKTKLKFQIGANSPFEGETDLISFDTKDGKSIRLWLAEIETRRQGKKLDVVQAEILDRRNPRLEKDASGKERPVAETYQLALHWPIPVGGSEARVRFPTRMRYLVDGKPVIEISTSRIERLRLNSIGPKEIRKLFEAPE